MTSEPDTRIVQDFSQEELRAPTAKHTSKYLLIVMNFMSSGEDSKIYRIPDNITGGKLYSGINSAINVCKLKNKIIVRAHKYPDGTNTVILMRADGEAAKKYKRQNRYRVYDIEVLKAIDDVSTASMVQAARICDVAKFMNKSHMCVHNHTIALVHQGLVASTMYGFYSVTAKGRNLLEVER